MTALSLSTSDVAIAGLLVLASAALSFALALAVHRPLLIAAARLVVQLILVGFVLRWLFQSASAWLTALAVVAMLAAASREVGTRSTRRLAGPWHVLVGSLAVTASTLLVALVALTTALRPLPWYDPRHLIPVVGIILGTGMNAGSLSLNAIFTSVTRERTAVEARLCLGATRWQALDGAIRQAVLAGSIPMLNQMAAAGIITLPGIMTGQVLAGMDPLEAAKYQIVLMFVLAAGGLLAAVLAAYGAVWRLTDDRHRLRLDRLAPLR